MLGYHPQFHLTMNVKIVTILALKRVITRNTYLLVNIKI